MMIHTPGNHEYSANFQRYIDLVPTGDFMQALDRNTETLLSLFGGVSEQQQDFRYAEGKWSIREMLMHIIDTERVFSYRMLVAARGDIKTILYPMDADQYAAAADVSGRNIADMLEEFKAVRASTRFLLNHITAEQSALLANGSAHVISARALGYITAGHAMHHMQILRERYLQQSHG